MARLDLAPWLICISAAVHLATVKSEFIQYGETYEERLSSFDEEIVLPVELTSEVYETHTGNRSREKRSLGDNMRHFSIRGFGEHFQLQMEPSTLLLAPGFKVYHRNNQDTVMENVDQSEVDCLYVGSSNHHPGSNAALNACGGLTGLIKTTNEEYLIQPVHKRTNTLGHHVLKKRALFTPKAKPTTEPSAESTSKPTKSPKKKKKKIIKKTKKTTIQAYYCGNKRRYMPRVPPKRYYWLPDEFLLSFENRKKRSLDSDQPRSVETLVVADRDMVLKHGAQNLTTYVLTVFNMVAMLYQDSTIGNNVSVILVGLVLLEGDEPGLMLSHNAESSLNSFCQWQSTIHTSKGKQHDHAVLVTGKDICSWKEGPCDTLGYAPISGMCSKYRSCTINEDSGLALAFTIAHEIGHNFGMVHDGHGSKCVGARGTIMSPSLSGLDSAFLWSSCSRRELAHFLRSQRALCLNNMPDFPDGLKFPDILPGQLYDGDMQCKFQFSAKSKLCRHYAMTDEICRALWCENGRKCETKFLPAAEGTVCGEQKWCRRGSCVPQVVESVVPVDGGWSPFSEWSNCSAACRKRGLRQRQRTCDSPTPKNGGHYCKGKSKEYSLCLQQDCSGSESKLDEDHCATFNHRSVKGKKYQWKPYGRDLGALARCRIYCAPDEADLHLVLSTKLPDGTSCQGNHSSVCLDGECRPVGCDGKVDSEVLPDRCGVCNGDNSTCEVVSGSYVAKNLSRGYHEIVRIPRQSRHINVSESEDYFTYLALRNKLGHYFLNGNWALHWPGRYMVAGAVFNYRRWPGQPEGFVSKGPVNEDLIVELLVQDAQEAVVNYEFVVSKQQTRWEFTNSSCSVTCGKGIITSQPKCTDFSGIEIAKEKCGFPVPPPQTFPCEVPCPAKWKIMPWTDCFPQGCKTTGWKTRQVFCTAENNVVEERFCKHFKKPETSEKCVSNVCTDNWVTSPWQPCDCSLGVQKRLVSCGGFGLTTESEGGCDTASRPPSHRKCSIKACPFTAKKHGIWISGTWSECSVTCGWGVQRRNVTCIPFGMDSNQRSYLTEAANCNEAQRPVSTTACVSATSCSSHYSKGCKDHKPWCASVNRKELCDRAVYSINCCKTCRTLR